MVCFYRRSWSVGVVAAIALCNPISSAQAQQQIPGLPGILGVFGGIINSEIAEANRRQWQHLSAATYNCLANRGVSVDQLANSGMGPSDPRLLDLMNQCDSARHIARKEFHYVEAGSTQFVVDGLHLDSLVNPESAAYRAYSCRPSDDFPGYIWCGAHHLVQGKSGSYTSWLSILHSNANLAVYVSQSIIPAFFQPGDADREILRLASQFNQEARVLKADPRMDLPHAVLAVWGAVTLTPLDATGMEDLRGGFPLHRGLLADFVGDPARSARENLPVYVIGGGPGFIWGAAFDDVGRGSLRIIAVDVSALGPPRRPVAPTIAPGSPAASTAVFPEIVPTTPLTPEAFVLPATKIECAKIVDGTERLACYDNAQGNSQAAPPPTPPQPSPTIAQPTPPQATPTLPEPTAAACKENWRLCMDNSDLMNSENSVVGLDAQVACENETNQRVKYGSPQWPWLPFTTFHSGSDYIQTGLITLIDKNVKIMNVYGTPVRSVVECRYNINNKKVEDVSIIDY